MTLYLALINTPGHCFDIKRFKNTILYLTVEMSFLQVGRSVNLLYVHSSPWKCT